MKELLSTARSIHHLVFILALVLLPVAPRPDKLGQITQAIAELRFWESYSHPNWVNAVVLERDKVVREWSGKTFGKELQERWKNHKTELEYAFPVLTTRPPKEAPLSEHLRWALGNQTGDSPKPEWSDFIDVPLPNIAYSKSDEDPSSLLGIDWDHLGTIERVRIGVEIMDQQPILAGGNVAGIPKMYSSRGASPRLKLVMKVSYKNQVEDAFITRDAEGGFSAIGVTVLAPVDILTDEAKKMLLPKDGNRNRLFPFLSMVWEDVQGLPPSKAYDYLREQRRLAVGTIDLLGVPVDLSQLSFAGPLALAGLLTYLLMHLRHAFILPIIVDDLESCRAIWGALFPGRLSRVVSFVSLVIVPTTVSVLLANRTAIRGSWEIAWMFCCVLVIGGLGMFNHVLIARLSRRIEAAPKS